MDDVYNNIQDYNPNRNGKILIVLFDMIAGIITNTKFQAIMKELSLRCRKIQSYFQINFYTLLKNEDS